MTSTIIRFGLPSAGLAFLCLAGSGCDAKLNSVEGQVLHNGQPAKGVIVLFHPAEQTATRYSGITDEAGKFTLSSTNGVGAVAGKYKVTLTWPEEVKPVGLSGKLTGTDTSGPEPKDRLGGKYETTEKSTIEIEIRSGRNQLESIKID
ncbi:MAG: hypothetical protein EXS09_03385 [Gemmataceae bacterium]|nr:hypothetical protein [Gemmataceae bacterium]